ncbi:DNA-binding transcriptional regulator, FadR family [Parafrankia irregularis]|uniref:DNA-binding transcriptional regulator, FadR family n=1 Tax=Parafrankia irregularis TaxID=795642 RepID=A0A0S4QT19_9ACTN|nr:MULTISPECIES: GntR family transcriptional regulator [Parafrankia]MBE3201760.1 FadR family transcriptional regulator [Parafrankia sp. CH37]CUU58238.1 DNA-binding transcriptional regulator, FadR family [Parafrankia irregularis]
MASKGSPREKPQQIADELRRLIVSGELTDGDLLGRESDLVARFGVSRPSLREALRILEAQGLISVQRGVLGGIFVRHPDEQATARTAALMLLARNVSLADVFVARSHLEPLAARRVADLDTRLAAVAELEALIAEQEAVMGDAGAFARVNAEFHQRLLALAGNQTLAIVAEMLTDIVARSVAAAQDRGVAGSLANRRRSVRSQRRLVELIVACDGPGAQEHWRSHMVALGKLAPSARAEAVVDLIDDY